MTENSLQASLADIDPQIAEVLDLELGRQRTTLEMIASENFVPRAVLEAQGSVLTNKYAEGYPGKRYYGGCEYVDVAESLAIDRAKSLFGAEYANVQPHSGASANAAVANASGHGHAPGSRVTRTRRPAVRHASATAASYRSPPLGPCPRRCGTTIWITPAPSGRTPRRPGARAAAP